MPWLLWGDHSFKYFSLFATHLTSMFRTAVFDNQKIIPPALLLLFSLRISLITREREREREREIKVTSKRLEEGQVQKKKKRL